MESLTHESDDSSSCTQSDSTNNSNGRNPFILRPRAGSSNLELSRDSHSLDTVEEYSRPFKLSCTVAPHHQHRAAIGNLQATSPSQYLRNGVATSWICDSDGLTSSAIHSQVRFQPSSMHEECTTPIRQPTSAAGVHHGSLAYLGSTQSFYTPDQWTGVRQQAYMLKHVAGHNTPPSTLLLPMRCKMEDVKAGSVLLGLADGRCRRTDGKKWRCRRAVVPNQKYCERHMHRGRGRSKAARVAKVNTTSVNGDLPPVNMARPFSKPLIFQSLNQCPIPAQPLNWLPKLAIACIEPDNEAPMLAQPLNESVNQATLLDQPTKPTTNPSRSLGWSHLHKPIRVDPPNSGHDLNRSTTFAARSGSKITNGSVIRGMSRTHMDDPHNVLTLDVEGIKRLLENAPCNNKRRRLLTTGQPSKESPNPAVFLDVAAHPAHLSPQPKQLPSLVDVVRMVEPPTYQLKLHTQLHADTMNSGKEDRPHTSLPLHLASLNHKHFKKSSSSIATLANSTNLSASPVEEAKLLPLFKVKHEEQHEVAQSIAEDGDFRRHTQGPTASASSSRTLDAPACSGEVSQGRSGINSHSPVLIEEMGHRIPGLVDESSSPHSNYTAKLDMNALDMNVSASVEERWKHLGSVKALRGNSPTPVVAESLNHNESSAKIKRGSFDMEYLAREEVNAIAEENISKPVRQSSDHHEDSTKLEVDLSIDMDDSTNMAGAVMRS